MNITSKKKEISFFHEFEKFINESNNGRRLQANGKRISHKTVKNYVYTLKILHSFCEKKKFALNIKCIKGLNSREEASERNYWKKFYRLFTNYLYDDCNYFDNYVGQNMKNIKAFFNYIHNQKGIDTGNFHNLFYIPKDEIAIFPLMPAELSFITYNIAFEESLKSKMKQVKDFFVFGCTVALRFSDLLALKKNNIREDSDQHFLVVKSIKTSVDTIVKLPAYAVAIIRRYTRLKKHLLPQFTLTCLNKYIKRLFELAGFTQQVQLMRNKRGKPIEIKTATKENKSWRLCDVASSHTMRRTAITTMLSLGVPEQVVRKISGHTPGSKEFYRYMFLSQAFRDQEMEKVFVELEKMAIVVS